MMITLRLGLKGQCYIKSTRSVLSIFQLTISKLKFPTVRWCVRNASNTRIKTVIYQKFILLIDSNSLY